MSLNESLEDTGQNLSLQKMNYANKTNLDFEAPSESQQ